MWRQPTESATAAVDGARSAAGSRSGISASATTAAPTAQAAARDATPPPSTRPPTATPQIAADATTTAADATMWRFDTTSSNHGVIGSGNVHAASRFLWHRMAPEEEEREEEALPSYLSYLQPAFHANTALGSDSNRFASAGFDPSPLSTASLQHAATARPFVPAAHQQQFHHRYTGTTAPFAATTDVETKSLEFAAALQAFVLTQLAHAPQSNLPPPGLAAPSNCQCPQLTTRVAELERDLQTLQRHVATLMTQGAGMGNTRLDVNALAHQQQQQQQHQAPLTPLTSPAAALSTTQLTFPLATPNSTSSNTTTNASAMSDRVSTLEGRQSAFQSQLAQIAKVLGVPVGKQHGKNSHVKTLVQTLRDEIDAKVHSATTELETKCVADVTEQLTTVVQHIVHDAIANERSEAPPPTAAAGASSATTSAGLSYETVLSALAEEHDASLTKLSAYFDDRLIHESTQRKTLERQLTGRLSEHEEWLQQLEGELAPWHDDATTTVATQLRELQSQFSALEATNRTAASGNRSIERIENVVDTGITTGMNTGTNAAPVVCGFTGPNTELPGTSTGTSSDTNAAVSTDTNAAVSIGIITGTDTGIHNLKSSSSIAAPAALPLDAGGRSLQQLQLQFKHAQRETKSDMAALRENATLMDSWVKTTRQETRDVAATVKGLKQLVEKLVRDTGSAEDLLQQYVSTITHQVASVTRQYVSVRIRDNNRLIDATLRARVPSYVANESERFMLVRPPENSENTGMHTGISIDHTAVVLQDTDENDAQIQQLLTAQLKRSTPPAHRPASANGSKAT